MPWRRGAGGYRGRRGRIGSSFDRLARLPGGIRGYFRRGERLRPDDLAPPFLDLHEQRRRAQLHAVAVDLVAPERRLGLERRERLAHFLLLEGSGAAHAFLEELRRRIGLGGERPG